MRYVNIGQYISEDRGALTMIYPLQSLCDREHGNLMHFLNADLSSMETQLQQYADNVISGCADPCPDGFYGMIADLHPYFQINPANISILLNTAFARIIAAKGFNRNKTKKLMRRLFAPRGLSPVCDEGSWLDGAAGGIMEGFGGGCLASFRKDQDTLRKMAVFFLDKGTKALSSFPPNTRLCLYGLCVDDGDPFGAGGFVQVSDMKIMYGRVTGSGSGAKDQVPLESLRADGLGEEAAMLVLDPDSPAPLLSRSAGMIPSSPKAMLDEILCPPSFFALLSLEIGEMYRHGETFSRNADGSFPAEKPGGVIADISEASSLKDTIREIYRKAYKTHHHRITYGTMTQEQFDLWLKAAREMKKKALNKTISLSEFSMWLKA